MKKNYTFNQFNQLNTSLSQNYLAFKDNFLLATYGGLQKRLLCRGKPKEENYA
jgi:hypothetical protein